MTRIDAPRYKDVSDMLRRGEDAAHCRRLRHWLRASVILNIILSTALAGALLGAYSSSNGAAASSSAPVFTWGTK